MGEQIKKVAIGAAVAAVGAALTFGTEQLPHVDLGAWTPLVVTAYSVFANIVRKVIEAAVAKLLAK